MAKAHWDLIQASYSIVALFEKILLCGDPWNGQEPQPRLYDLLLNYLQTEKRFCNYRISHCLSIWNNHHEFKNRFQGIPQRGVILQTNTPMFA